jgi:hypothetical protein
MDDAEVEMRLRHVDALSEWISVRLRDLVARIEIRSPFHLDHGVATLVVEVQVVAVLQKCPTNGDGALVVERRTIDEIGLYVGCREAVVQPVSVSRVLVVHDVGNHHVADIRIESRSLAEDIHAGHPRGLLGDLSQDVIRGLAERVVDVERSFCASTLPTRGSIVDASSFESMKIWAAESTPVPTAAI